MSDQIKSTDIFEPGIFTKITKEAKAFNDALGRGTELIKIMKKVQGDLAKNGFKNAKDVNDANKAMQDSILLQQKYEKARNDVAKTAAAAAAAEEKAKQQALKTDRDRIKLQRDINRMQADAAKQQAANIKITAQAQSAYYKLNKQLLDNKKAVKDLLASGKELTEGDKKLIQQTQELDKRLKEIDATVGDNQRNVGAYREALNDVLAEMGAFGGIITKVARTLKELQEQTKGNTSGWKKFGDILKAGLIGVALAVVSAALKANEAANELSETLKATSDKIETLWLTYGKAQALTLAYEKSNDSLAKSAEEVRIAYANLIDTTRLYEESQRRMQIDLQKLTLDQDDYNQVAADTTIGYNERIAAQKESIVLGEKIAKKNIEIAAASLKQADADYKTSQLISKGSTKEIKDKLLEAQLKYNEAVSAEKNIEYAAAQQTRDLNSQKTNSLIDLTLKNKLAANSKKALLEQELADEKNQLEERRKIAEKISDENNAVVAEELRIFQRGNNIKLNSIELLSEEDAILLAKKLDELKTNEGLTLGDSQRVELAKIIKQFQDGIVEAKKNQKVLDDEELKRTQKIAELTAQISDIKTQQQEEDARMATDKAKKALEKRGTYLNNEVKNVKLSILQEESLKDEHLANQRDIEKQRVIDTVNDEKTKQKELEKIDEEYRLNRKKLHDDFETQNLDFDKKISDERRKILKEEADAAIQFAEQAAKRKDDLTEKQLNNDLDMRQRNIIQQQQLAEQGYNNTLAFEKAAAAKDELEKEKLAAKQERREKAIAFLKLFSAYAEKDPDEAVSKAFVQAAIAGAIAGSYFEGTENVGEDLKGNKIHNGRDGYVVAVDGSERILTGEQNKMIGNLSNDELAQLAANHNGLIPKYMTAQVGSFAENSMNSLMLQQFTSMNEEIKSIKKELKSRPVQQVDLTRMGEVIDKKIVNGLTIERRHTSQSPLNYL